MQLQDIPGLVHDLHSSFESGRTQSIDWRKRQLEGIRELCHERGLELADALHADLGKPPAEAYPAEISFVAAEARAARRKLASWMKPQSVPSPVVAQPAKSSIHKQPYGVVLIIAPWNYPFQLSLSPLVGAIAAGNCVVIKPSEVSEHMSRAIARLLPQYVDSSCVKVVEGGVPETTALLEQRFDYIFYTGNGTVGRVVMQAAAKHLTPLTLELGGKSPCIVDRDVNLEVACRRIVWGKFYNAGQTCVAPDYVLAHKDVHDALLERLAATVREFYGEEPKESPDFGRIINRRHVQRLARLLEGARCVTGGVADESSRYIAPTILRDVSPDDAVMADEIFGPILPVLKVDSMDAAIRFVNARSKPLALYLFSGKEDVQDRVLEGTTSGGATINHAFIHLTNMELPFGGVGPSGMGAYHGKASFDTFTHQRAVMRKPFALDPTVLYPPYNATKLAILKKLI